MTLRRLLLLGLSALAALSLHAQRRRAVAPPIYVGHVDVAVAFVLSPGNLAEAQLHVDELTQAGLRLVGGRLVADSIPAAGFRVRIGSQEAMVRSDGSFLIENFPEAAEGEVIGKEIVLQRFPVAAHLVRLGGDPIPIVVTLELSDQADLMNDWDQAMSVGEPKTESVLRAIAPEGVCPAPDSSCMQDTNCPMTPTTCCLDYNGLCADGKRYQGDGCKLRFLQFIGSTCHYWTQQRLCCFNEGAVRGVAGLRGPRCYDNHKWRICQSLELESEGGLRFTTGPLNPPPAAVSETHDVSCGHSVTINLYNNTCDNETEVTLNSWTARVQFAVLCPAGGTVTPLGKLPHYNNATQTHTPALTLTYTAPAQVPDCFTTPTDVVTAEAGGGFRAILFKVSCTKGQVGAVVFSPPPGMFTSSTDISMTSPTTGATIHYTTNGTEPTESSPSLPNGGSVRLVQSATLSARAFLAGYTPSTITTGIYSIAAAKVAAPMFYPPEGTYSMPIDVQITSATAGAFVHYTVDGSTPTESSASTLPLHIATNTVVRARAFRAGMQPSDVVTATYAIAAAKVAAPMFYPPEGMYPMPIDVQITSPTAGAIVHYTTDGSTPTESSPSALPLHITRNTIVRARAFHAGMQPSDVITATYAILQ